MDERMYAYVDIYEVGYVWSDVNMFSAKLNVETVCLFLFILLLPHSVFF